MSIATKALSIIGGAAIKTIPFQQWGIGDGISGTSTFDRTWLPTQPGSAHNYREDAGDLLQNSVVAAGVSAVGQALGEAPPMLEERQGDNWVKVTDHPAIHKLNNPNGYYTMNHLWIAQAGSEITNGEGFWRITMNSQNEPAEIWWERPDMVRIIGDKGAFIDGYELMVNGIPYPVEAAINFKKTRATDYMIHFRAALNHYNPRTGWSPLQAGYRQVVGDNAATTYHTSLMRNVTAVGLLVTLRSQLENGQNITPDQFDAIKTKINQAAKGEGAGSTVAINLPLDVNRLGLTPDEMAIDRLISYYEYRIASLIGVDVMVLGLGSGTQQKTYANFAEAISDFQERRIVPTKNRQAEELRIQYLPLWGLDPEKYRIVWDYSKVPVMQENEDEKHNRVRADWVSGVPDLYQTATLLGYEADESMKGVRYQGGQNAAPPTPEEIAQQKKLNNAAKSDTEESLNMPENAHDTAAKAAPPLPEHDPDPFGMAFTQEEIDKLTDVNSEAAVKAAFADATPEMRALLSAQQIDRK